MRHSHFQRIGGRIALAFVPLLCLMLGVAGFALAAGRNADSALAAGEHGAEVLAQVEALSDAMQDMQAAARGFLVAADPADLGAWEGAHAAFEQARDRARELLADDDTQQRRLDEASRLQARYAETARALMLLRRAVLAGERSPQEFFALQRHAADEQAMADLRAVQRQLVQAERQRERLRLEAAAWRGEVAEVVLVAACVLASVLCLVLARRLSRSIAEPLRRALWLAESAAAGHLHGQVRLEGPQEVRRVLGALQALRDRLRPDSGRDGAPVRARP